ncbi:unnamed protein product, partial [Bubo scandiacus]
FRRRRRPWGGEMQDERRAESGLAALLPRGELEKERERGGPTAGDLRARQAAGARRPPPWICGKRTVRTKGTWRWCRGRGGEDLARGWVPPPAAGARGCPHRAGRVPAELQWTLPAAGRRAEPPPPPRESCSPGAGPQRAPRPPPGRAGGFLSGDAPLR